MGNSQQNIPKVFLEKEQGKYKVFQAQLKRVVAALYRPMLIVSIETSILQTSSNSYIAEWEKKNRIKIVRKDVCLISKHCIGFYTTHQIIFPKSNHLNIVK